MSVQIGHPHEVKELPMVRPVAFPQLSSNGGLEVIFVGRPSRSYS
ncbi:hypothetical protein [Microbacterium hydrocarbonoxydans]|nr:hypothetical protein [Microbacterium hydrocarbonoxydans]